MPYFQWSDALETQMSLIDDQHREYVARTNAFLGQCLLKDAESAAGLGGTFTFLHSYIEEHLATEEALMARYDYPYVRSHLSQHSYFRDKVEAAAAGLTAGTLVPAQRMRLNYVLVDWFQKHIRLVDQRLTRYLWEVAESPEGWELRQWFANLGEDRGRSSETP